VEESGKIDGATEWQLFTRLVLPLVLPGIAAIAMLSFLYAWNEYTYSVILTRSPSNYTIPLALAVLNTEDNVTNFGLVAAGGVSSVIYTGGSLCDLCTELPHKRIIKWGCERIE